MTDREIIIEALSQHSPVGQFSQEQNNKVRARAQELRRGFECYDLEITSAARYG